LAGYPDWEIVIRVVVGPKGDETWMELAIAEDEIIDDLQRDPLPPEFRDLTYPGSKPPKIKRILNN
jgi:hypothetical protein